ncbi:MAG: hypothetical protein Q8Q14_00675 [Gemmatimonadales bacterium]|nr:hypothetical protein [Gemmatimonadales bacterium]
MTVPRAPLAVRLALLPVALGVCALVSIAAVALLVRDAVRPRAEAEGGCDGADGGCDDTKLPGETSIQSAPPAPAFHGAAWVQLGASSIGYSSLGDQLRGGMA